MKRPLLLFFSILVLMTCEGKTDETGNLIHASIEINGTEYKNVTLRSVNETELVIFHDDGAATFKVRALKRELIEILAPQYMAARREKEQEALRKHNESQQRAKEELERTIAEQMQKAYDDERIRKERARQAEVNRVNQQVTQEGTTSISRERQEFYFSPQARQEARELLKETGTANPSQAEIDLILKLNERLEYYNGR